MRGRLVVLGCGFGGYSLLAGLRRSPFAEVVLVSPRNYFLFTPLLPSAVAGTVEFRSILEPARRRLRHVRLVEAEAISVDLAALRARCRGAVGGEVFDLDYERLVIAVGATIADHGVPGVREHAVTVDDVDGARRARRAILEQFARAEIPGLPLEEVRQRLTFVVCGGGATGVEVAAEIRDLLGRELRRSYPELAPQARVVLLEAGRRLLTSFDEALSEYAARHFRRERIEVRTESPVAAVEEGRVRLADGTLLPCGMVVWAGGNAPRPLVRALDVARTPGGRIVVDDRLRVPGWLGVYALGDCAARGEPPLPATAQVAQSEGRYLARALRREGLGRPVAPFAYRSLGMLAYIGAGRALADLPRAKWSGRAAWIFWRSVYLTRLVSTANKVKVLFDWAKAMVLGRDLSRF